MLEYSPGAGEHIETTAANMVIMAGESGESVSATFNDVKIVAYPGDEVAAVLDRYSSERDRLSAQYWASPEGKEAARKAEEARKEAEAAEAEGILPFSVSDQALWDDQVNGNIDPYGAAIIRYAARWAHLMEKRISDGSELEDIAEASSFEANKEGVTGFMYGCAVSILSEVWTHGEELRRWHNLDTQIGAEGEKANEAGGVLNPALLSIGSEDTSDA